MALSSYKVLAGQVGVTLHAVEMLADVRALA